jgi:putative intracellular protease/amidase
MESELKGCVLAILAANGTDARQVSALREGLRERGGRVHVLALAGEPPRAGGGGHLEIDAVAEEASPGYYDAIVVPGGDGSADLLANRRGVLQLLREMHERRRVIGALEDGVSVLERAGLPMPEGSDESVKLRDRVAVCADSADVETFLSRFGQLVRSWRTQEYVDEASKESFPASDPASGAAI